MTVHKLPLKPETTPGHHTAIVRAVAPNGFRSTPHTVLYVDDTSEIRLVRNGPYHRGPLAILISTPNTETNQTTPRIVDGDRLELGDHTFTVEVTRRRTYLTLTN